MRGVRDGKQVWRQLRTDPDYVADWRAHSAAPIVEAAPFPFRRQTAADLEAARWNLLAWVDPRFPARVSPFWADVPMVNARVMDPAKSGGDALRHIVRKSRATFTGLRLRDGTLVLKVSRGRKAEQIRVTDGETFNPKTSGLMMTIPIDGSPQAVGTASRVWAPSSSLVVSVRSAGDG